LALAEKVITLDCMGFFSINNKTENRLKDEVDAKTQLVEQLTSEVQHYKEQLDGARSELERFKISSGMASLAPDEQMKKYDKLLVERDSQIAELRKELDSLRREMDEQLATHSKKMQAVLNEKDKQIKRLDAGGAVRNAVAAESDDRNIIAPSELVVIPKNVAEKKCITEALLSNTFMRGLSQNQLRKLIDAMEKGEYAAGTEIITENGTGNEMYIIQDGEVQVTKGKGKNATHIVDLKSGLFGELAIMYNCKRTATVKSKTHVNVWKLHRQIFQMVVKSAGQEKDEERYQILKSVKDFADVSEGKLRKIVDCLEEEHFDEGATIIKQGEVGDNFFIIKSGSVVIKINSPEGEKEVARKSAGEFFGEKALLSEDKRSANVYADGGPVLCLTLDRIAFTNLIGTLDNLKADEEVLENSGPERVIPEYIKNSTFKDVNIIKPLGAGGFGLVKLVNFKASSSDTYALKCIQKHRVVQYGQERHIMDEKHILDSMKSPFILGLLKTYKDNKYVYILTDAYLGGDLWRLLHQRGPFNDTVGRFYTACVISAFEYLHARHFCYRDLKPENLMVDRHGYVRLVDLGFAKKVLPGHKTWTFCGTPEYISPEIISNTGHNICADLWSLGVLIYELLSKKTPFRAKDDLAIYEGILRGIHSIQFPYKISRKAESLIKALCRQDPQERIGYQKNGYDDIKKHRWFQGFDWEALQHEKLVPPFTPEIKNENDTSNFERIKDDDRSKVPDETSGWDSDF
jgi:cGMP-dependent protein kinase